MCEMCTKSLVLPEKDLATELTEIQKREGYTFNVNLPGSNPVNPNVGNPNLNPDGTEKTAIQKYGWIGGAVVVLIILAVVISKSKK